MLEGIEHFFGAANDFFLVPYIMSRSVNEVT